MNPERAKGLRIELFQGDITQLAVDAIVNAANESLLGGSGVDGAIHRGAGPELGQECSRLGGCRTGEAKLTKGYALPAKHVIHTVGPIWHGGIRNEREDLVDCYRNSLRLASQHDLKSVAFPCISTGAHMFPNELAADVAVSTVKSFLQTHPDIERVVFVTFTDRDHAIYRKLLGMAPVALKGKDEPPSEFRTRSAPTAKTQPPAKAPASAKAPAAPPSAPPSAQAAAAPPGGACPHCGAKGEASKFCSQCGKPIALKPACAKCGAKLAASAKFCPECGTPR